jgi:hypothetical protein
MCRIMCRLPDVGTCGPIDSSHGLSEAHDRLWQGCVHQLPGIREEPLGNRYELW